MTRVKGFTLLEIMAVMVLTAMVVTLLLQGLHQTFRIQAHFGAETFNAQQGAMHVEWFRQSINGLMPDYDDGKNKFKGRLRELSGLTMAPLDAPVGALAPFLWRIAYSPEIGETALYYGSGADAPVIMSWPGNEGRFVFVDANGQQHTEWPPFSGKNPQIPGWILLDRGSALQVNYLVAIPRGPEKPWPKWREIEGG